MNAHRRNEFTFQIPFDRSTGGYGEAEIRTRLVSLGEASAIGVLAEDSISLTESSGILDLKSRIERDEIIITTRVRDEALRRRGSHPVDNLKVSLDIMLPETDEAPGETLSAHFRVALEAAPEAEPSLTMKSLGTEMPIPACSHKPARITFQLLNGEDGEPAVQKEASWEKKSEIWQSIITPLCGISDDVQGLISFSYTPPDLFYTPETPLSEKIIVYSGTNGKKREIGSLELVLAPHVFCTLEAAKKGLSFRPVELRLEPDDGCYIRAISGRACLTVKDQDSEKTVEIPVSDASVTIRFRNGEHYSETVMSAESDEDGFFVFELPGLEYLPAARGMDYHLDQGSGGCIAATLDTGEEAALSALEDRLKGLISAYNLPLSLQTHRAHHYRQIASGTPELSGRRDDALNYLLSTMECTAAFEELNRERRERLSAAMEQIISVIFELVDVLGSLPGAIERDSSSISVRITGAGGRSGIQTYMRRLIQSTTSSDLRKATEELQQRILEISSPAFPEDAPVMEICRQSFQQGLQEMDSLAGSASYAEISRGDTITAEYMVNICAILGRTASIIRSSLIALFPAAFQKALAAFSGLEATGPDSLQPCGPALTDRLRGIAESAGSTGEMMRKTFAHMAGVTCRSIGDEMADYLLAGADADLRSHVTAAVDSMDWPRALAGMVISSALEDVRDLSFQSSPAEAELRRCRLMSRLESFTGAEIECPSEMDSSLDCMNSLICYLDRQVAALQSLCSFVDAPSLTGLTGRLDQLGQAFKSFFRTFPGVTADAADSLHLSVIYSMSTLSPNPEEAA